MYKLHAVYLITYFKYLHFNYLTTLQTNTQNNLGFSHALPAARVVYLNTQIVTVWQPNIRNML